MAYKEIDESSITLIDSVSSFIEMIRQVKETKEAQDGTSTELYFRGQETEFWDIEPSIFRDDMLSIEHKLMQIPLQKSPTEFRDLNSMFDIMTKYQHYGMCTRLLDLTTNPLVALYFACKKHGAVKYVTEDGEVEKEPYGGFITRTNTTHLNPQILKFKSCLPWRVMIWKKKILCLMFLKDYIMTGL